MARFAGRVTLVDVADDQSTDIGAYFAASSAHIAQLLAAGKRVLVHCWQASTECMLFSHSLMSAIAHTGQVAQRRSCGGLSGDAHAAARCVGAGHDHQSWAQYQSGCAALSACGPVAVADEPVGFCAGFLRQLMQWEMSQRGLQRSTIHDSFHKLRAGASSSVPVGRGASGLPAASTASVAPPEDCAPVIVAAEGSVAVAMDVGDNDAL